MKIATASKDGRTIIVALLRNGLMLDIAKAKDSVSDEHADVLKSGSLQKIIESGSDVLEALQALVDQAEAGGQNTHMLAAGDVVLMAPIPVPKKNIFCVGRNYAKHIAEGNRAQKANIGVTEHPVFFTKPPTSIVAPDGDILMFPTISKAIDYEVELTIVISKPGRNISKADAYDHIFGYTILNDITARDIQRRHGGQYFRGKGLDGSCPIGPWIVTADEIENPHALSIGTTVNSEQRQDGNTSEMIFDIPTLIASLSEGLTLEPGDMIATGTPSGVGYAMDPPQFLKDGDVVACSISGIGTLSNTVRAI